MATNMTAANAAEPDPDIDRSWFVPVSPHSNGLRQDGNALTLPQIVNCANALLDLLRDEPSVRERYYNLSREWHKNWYANKIGNDLEFGEQLCGLLETVLTLPVKPLQLSDFAYIHAYVFYSLRRSVIALTGHDIDPDSWPLGAMASRSARDLGNLFSFHWPPNGIARTVNLSVLTDMGFSESSP